MRRFVRLVAVATSLCVLPMALAAPKVADYPLRVRIVGRSEITHLHNGVPDGTRGQGRGNLFENSQARGFEFSFECSDHLMSSSGYETYPAKWKKPGQELTILLPVMGKLDKYWSCDLKVQMKDLVYTSVREGQIGTRSVEDFKKWMVEHDYDPEHGKNMPISKKSTDQSAKPSQDQ